LALRDADADGVTPGALVEVAGDQYTVVEVEPDGTGITTLVLRPRT